MKHIIYLTILSFLLLAGCSKPSPAPAPAPEHFSKYIFFSHSVETKAELVKDAAGLNEKSFGVVGFKYDERTDWATYSTTEVNGNLPEPNVFYDDDNTTPVDVETVGVDGTRNENEATIGTASYTPLQGWSNSKKYTFFAFYPVENSAISLVNLDGDDYSGGVPAVKYTNPDLEKSKMVDVMTSPAHIDRFWKSSAEGGNNIPSGEVSFTLQHRLSVLGVKIKNSSEGSITVTSVTLEVSGLLYSDMTMPLDYTSKETKTSSKTNADSALSGTFALSLDSGQTFAVAQTPEYDELSDKLIFIPQTEKMTIKATIGYKRNAYDGYSTVESTKTVENLETALAEGQKQMISFNFTDSKVDVSISKGPWSNKHEVDNSFN